MQIWFKNRNYKSRERWKGLGRGTVGVIKVGRKRVLEYIAEDFGEDRNGKKKLLLTMMENKCKLLKGNS
jgi:hypothetical protein